MNRIVTKNSRFSKRLKVELKRNFKIKNFIKRSRYFIYTFNKYSIVYFEVDNYLFGIWQHTRQVFADHKGDIDKFRPNRTYFSKDYTSIKDIIDFVREVISYNGEELKDWEYSLNEELKEQIQGYKHFENNYHYLLSYEGISRIKVIKNKLYDDRTVNVLLNEELSSYSDEDFLRWRDKLEDNMPNWDFVGKIHYFNM